MTIMPVPLTLAILPLDVSTTPLLAMTTMSVPKTPATLTPDVSTLLSLAMTVTHAPLTPVTVDVSILKLKTVNLVVTKTALPLTHANQSPVMDLLESVPKVLWTVTTKMPVPPTLVSL